MFPLRVVFDLDQTAADWATPMLSNFPGKDIEWLNKHPKREEMMCEIYEREPHFFANLECFEGFLDLMTIAIDIFGEQNVGWVSAIGHTHPNSRMVREDKLQWIKTNVDDVLGISSVDRAIIVPDSPDKVRAFPALTNIILVDDYERNVREWFEAGGYSYLWKGAEYTPKKLEEIKDWFVMMDKVMRVI